MEKFVLSLKQWLRPGVFLPGQIIFRGFPYNQICYVFPHITYLCGFQSLQYLQCWLKAMILVAKAIRGLVPALWKSRIFDLWTAASALHSRARSGCRLRVSVSNKGIWLQNSILEEHSSNILKAFCLKQNFHHFCHQDDSQRDSLVRLQLTRLICLQYKCFL